MTSFSFSLSLSFRRKGQGLVRSVPVAAGHLFIQPAVRKAADSYSCRFIKPAVLVRHLETLLTAIAASNVSEPGIHLLGTFEATKLLIAPADGVVECSFCRLLARPDGFQLFVDNVTGLQEVTET